MKTRAMFSSRMLSVSSLEADFRRTGKHTIEIFEPIWTNAPRSARPYCCYLSTVVFHKDPSRTEEYGRVDLHSFGTSPHVFLIKGLTGAWELMGGHVKWTRGRWHMVRGAADNTKWSLFVDRALDIQNREDHCWLRINQLNRAVDSALSNLQALSNLLDDKTALAIVLQTAKQLGQAYHGTGADTDQGRKANARPA